MMRLLILHGPNMNLFGIRSAKEGNRLTLDKINRHIRCFIRGKNLEITIMQTHSEVKAVSYIQKNRKKIGGIIITPGPWDSSGYVLLELLNLINMNHTIINRKNNKKNNLFKDSTIIYNTDILKSFEEAILQYVP